MSTSSMIRIRTFFLSFFCLVLIVLLVSHLETMCHSEISLLSSDAFAQGTTGEEIIEPPPPPPDDTDDTKPPDLPPAILDSSPSFLEIQRPFTPAISAEVDDFTGSAHLDYPVLVPPGRKGLTPKLSLKYSSSGTNTWVGVGWDISAGYIQRRGPRRGVPKYTDLDTFELSLNGGSPQELASIGNDEYRHKIEGPFYKIKYYSSDPSGDNYWEVTDKTGVKMKFGSTLNSKIGTQRDLNPGTKNQTYRWYLDQIKDPNTNYMELAYWRDQDTGNTFQVYLQEVRYNGNSTTGFLPNLKVTFNLETSERSDKIYNYRGGFKMWTRRRLSSIEVWAGTERVRRYQLQYTVNTIYKSRSQLTSIKLYGSDNTTYLVPTNFTYLNQWSNITEPFLWFNSSVCDQGGGMYVRDNSGYGYSDFIDLNGDALPDRVVNYLSAPSCVSSNNRWTVYSNNRDGFDDGVEWQNQGYQNGVGNYLRVWDTNNPASKSELIDMNGDGRPDRVRYKVSCPSPYTDCPWSVYLNNGSGFDSNFISWTNPSAWGPVNGNHIRNEAVINGFSKGISYDVIDMNGDGLPDRVVYDKTSPYSTWTVYFNNGSGFGPSTDWPNPSATNHIETWDYSLAPCMGTGVIDMNGDGLPDRVVKNRSTGAWTVYFSTGSGFGPATSWPIQGGDQGGGCIRTVEFGATLADLIDMNGDGLPDRFASGYGVYYNTGSGFGPLSAWPILGSGLYATSVSDQYGTYASVFDITGDGLPDQVVSYVDNPPPNNFWYWFIHPNLGPLPDLLQKVENGIGGTIEFSYKPSTEYPNNYLPFVVQTASSIKTNDGNGVISTTNYTYEGGYFSATEREFRGFEYVKQTKPDQTTVETWYYTGSDPQTEDDDILKGFPYDQITKGSTGSTYLQAHNTYNITSPYTNVNFPYLERKDEYEYDGYGDPPRQSAIAFTYDSYGNVTRKQSLGDVSISTDDKDENTEYFYNATKWIVSLPTSKDIKDYTGAIKAKTWFEYDQGLRDKGNLTQKTLWLAGNQTDPANPVYNYTYDPSYGNLIAITDPKTNTTTLSYDTVTNTYPYQITNSKGHLNVLTYSPKFGKLLTVTDLNTNTTTYEYDVFGRLKKTKRPYDEQSIYGTVTYNYENFGTVGQQRIATLATEQSGTSNYLWKETYFDGLGRMIKTRQEGPDGKVNLTKTEYNTRGFIYRTSLPYFENLETTRWKTFAYDPMGRVMQITYPDNTSTTITHVKGVTTIIDQNGHQKKEKRDVFKRLATVEEYTGSNPNFTLYAITNYGYDVLDNNVSVTDAATPANVTTMVYDPLSRKIEMTDPDMGFWEYEYDKNNNLTSQTDAKNVTITYLPEGYDELNRPKVKHYPVGEIVYTYDEGFPFTNSLGRLTTVTDESGTTKLYYDKLGRVTKTIKTVDEIDYTIETTYDPLDRTRTIKYPDNETVTFTYDTGGNLGSIPGYVTSYTNYNALGQPGTITYPNGVVTTKTYRTDNNRLNRILTSPSYQDLTYGYDNKGNVASIADALDATRGQSFTYDELDRLRFAISSSYGTIEYQYSQIGNMTLNSQVGSYLYQSPKPHAVTRAGSIDYTYDPNGNMETGAGRTIVSNYDNKPSSITIGGATTSFIYDYQGQRVKKISGGLPTLYIGKLYECTSGVCTKYIFGGITRIDLKAPAEPKDLLAFGGIGAVGEKQEAPFGAIGTKFIADVYAKQTIENEQRVALKSSTAICGSNILYYHTDHLGSSNVITNVSGGNAEGVYYYPFGATRLQTGGDCVNHKFTGQEEDGETGLYNYGARYYDPVLGRFTSADSIVPDYTNPQALNRYSYVLNNPLKYIDPTGQEATDYDYYGTDPPGASENPADSRSTENDPTQLAQIFSDEDDRMLDNFLPVDPEKEEKKQIEREKQRAERDAVRGAALRAAAEIAIEILGFFYGFETPKGFFDPDRDFEHGPNRDPN